MLSTAYALVVDEPSLQMSVKIIEILNTHEFKFSTVISILKNDLVECNEAFDPLGTLQPHNQCDCLEEFGDGLLALWKLKNVLDAWKLGTKTFNDPSKCWKHGKQLTHCRTHDVLKTNTTEARCIQYFYNKHGNEVVEFFDTPFFGQQKLMPPVPFD